MKYEIINNNPKNFKVKYWIDDIEYYLHSTSTERYVVVNNVKHTLVNGRVLPRVVLDPITLQLLQKTTLTATSFELVANPPQEKKPSKSRRASQK
ncbi:hypothetical protein ACSTWI_000815 [Escherichia coli]|nr:hypothetical protein [Escherichia coli]